MVEMELLAPWSTCLPCCTRFCPTPQPLVSPQLSAGPGRAAFQNITCYLHFHFACRWISHTCSSSFSQSDSCLSVSNTLSGEAVASITGKMSTFIHPVYDFPIHLSYNLSLQEHENAVCPRGLVVPSRARNGASALCARVTAGGDVPSSTALARCRQVQETSFSPLFHNKQSCTVNSIHHRGSST